MHLNLITALLLAAIVTAQASLPIPPVEQGETLAHEVTRADAVTALWQHVGMPEAELLPTAGLSGGNRGVVTEELLAEADEAHRDALRWAASERILPESFTLAHHHDGGVHTTETVLRTDAFLTRAELASLCWRIAEMRGDGPLMINDEIDAMGITDTRDAIVEGYGYLREAAWCVREGIMELDDGSFRGRETVTEDVLLATLAKLDAAVPVPEAVPYPITVIEDPLYTPYIDLTEACPGDWVAFNYDFYDRSGDGMASVMPFAADGEPVNYLWDTEQEIYLLRMPVGGLTLRVWRVGE